MFPLLIKRGSRPIKLRSLLVVAEAAVVQQAPAPIMLYVYIGLYRP